MSLIITFKQEEELEVQSKLILWRKLESNTSIDEEFSLIQSREQEFWLSESKKKSIDYYKKTMTSFKTEKKVVEVEPRKNDSKNYYQSIIKKRYFV